MDKRRCFKLFSAGFLAISLLLAGCSPQSGKTNAVPKAKAESSQTVNETINTKNTTRITGNNAEQLAISTSKMIWPATKAGTAPNVVLLAPKDNWQAQLVGLDLVHHPSDGPLLVADTDGISKPIMDELMRLKPKGAADGTQVITIGLGKKAVKAVSEHFKVKEIKGINPNQLALAIDSYYAEVSGSLPSSVVVSTSESLEYAAPAGNWISHMPEPLLYVQKNEVPAETREALQKRQGKATVYLLGPESVINKKVEKELGKYGKVVRIAGDDPVSNAIAFAQYKDPATGFGWGITNPGHGFLLGNLNHLKESIPTAPFAHRGKHAPLLLTEGGKAPNQLLSYFKEVKPLYKKEPTEGPYNHLYLIGGEDWISWEQQGDLDHLVEIESANGDSHGSHDGGHQQQTNTDKPTPEDHGQTDHSNKGHSGHH
jgi:hypothetical protein